MKLGYKEGSAHMIVIAAVVVSLLAALGFVFYKNFIAKGDSTTQTAADTKQSASTKAEENTITAVDGTDMMRYTNNQYGFRFDFPRQAYGSTGCEVQKQWYDNNGKLYDAPVMAYIAVSGMAEMTVLESDNTYTIAQKQAPLFTLATYGDDKRQYYSECKMTAVTQVLIHGDGQHDLSTPYRSWQVYRIGSQDEIAVKAKELDSLAYNDNVTSVEYSLGALENGRQAVSYTFTFEPNDGYVGGGATKTWYYPEQKLLVHIGLGQSYSFAKDSTEETYYIDEIVESFTVF